MTTDVDATELVRLARIRRMAKSGEARALRKRAAISTPELARALGCTAETIRLWEEGEATPRTQAALRWLAILDQLVPEGSDAA